jgi:hypothetical protein
MYILRILFYFLLKNIYIYGIVYYIINHRHKPQKKQKTYTHDIYNFHDERVIHRRDRALFFFGENKHLHLYRERAR